MGGKEIRVTEVRSVVAAARNSERVANGIFLMVGRFVSQKCTSFCAAVTAR